MENGKKDIRNLGIDMLRIVAMFMIVWGHVARFSFDFFDKSLSHDSCQYILLNLIHLLCLVGVNVYAVISGYVMVNQIPRLRKLFSIWLQLVFISFSVAWCARSLNVDLAGRPLWKYALPISQNCWWYMTAYFGMYPFLPFINRALANMAKREMLILGGCIIVFFSLCPTFLRNRNLFQLEHGYSCIWLLACYVLGAMARLVQDDIEAFLCKFHLSIGKVLAGTILIIMFLAIAQGFVSGTAVGKVVLHLYDAYVSPLMLLYAMAILLFFSKLRIPDFLGKIVLFISSLTLPIYLFHIHPVVAAQLFFASKHRFYAQNYSCVSILFISLAFAIMLFAASGILGFCQMSLFRLCKKALKR